MNEDQKKCDCGHFHSWLNGKCCNRNCRCENNPLDKSCCDNGKMGDVHKCQKQNRHEKLHYCGTRPEYCQRCALPRPRIFHETSGKPIDSGLREENRDWENELKDFTHIRSGNDIRGACGSPCFQCQKDLVLRELISRIESAAYKKGKEEVTKLYAENHLMVKNHNDTPIDIDATIDNARADEREIVAREAIKIAIDSENLTEELERLKALQSLLPKENQGE